MTATRENISALRAVRDGDAWLVTFASDNPGRVHQLYANARLVDWTESPGQRTFRLAAADAPRELVVAAVDPRDAAVDFARELALDAPWTFLASVVRDPNQPRDARLELLDDRATGTLDADPLLALDLWPAHLQRWQFGEDRFGLGGFGFDGALAPAMSGAFGVGGLGFDADMLRIAADLAEPGVHQLALRTLRPGGEPTDAAATFTARVPPSPPATVEATHYDADAHLLTLQIQ